VHNQLRTVAFDDRSSIFCTKNMGQICTLHGWENNGTISVDRKVFLSFSGKEFS